jgi:hypothetical protein
MVWTFSLILGQTPCCTPEDGKLMVMFPDSFAARIPFYFCLFLWTF